ncbi:MAG: thiamine pyrophosphate-dependent enzyme, partial [Candidatus Krumholzibacteriia bacterium]
LAALVEQTHVPVGVTQAGKGALADAHRCCLGAIGATGTSAANRIARDADLVVLVGTRLSDFTTASKTLFQDPDVRFVSVQINAFDAHKHGALPLLGDAQVILEDLCVALRGFVVDRLYEADILGVRQEWERMYEEIVRPPQVAGRKLFQSEVIRIVNEHAGDPSTVVHAAGGLPGDLHKLWRSSGAGDYHSEYGYSCMGYEIAGALGVKMAHPEREVYALVGDGSYLMLHTELVTSIQEGLKITIVLIDNGGYQCIHGLQKSCGGRSFGNEFRQRDAGPMRLEGEYLVLDFAQNARSLGAVALRVESEAALIEALTAAREQTRTTLIHVPVEPSGTVPGFAWWDVPVAETSDVQGVRDARGRYEEARKKRVFYY